MKQLISTVLLALFSVWAGAQPKNVLFIGNSLTFYYGMPTTFSEMANAAGDRVSVSQHTVSNTGLVHHVANPQLYALIRSKTWDYVVIQPGSGESYGSTPVNVVSGYLRQIQDSIYHYSPCAQVILYEISNGINGTSQQYVTEYKNIQSKMLQTLQQLADAGEVPLAPAGEVLRNLFLGEDMMMWEGVGNIHPNPYGSYAITCAMYNTIFKKPVSGMSLKPLRWARDLDTAQCALIQRIADSVVLKTPPATWRYGAYHPYALFAVQPIDGNTVRFTSYSLGYDRLQWTFPDGTTSAAENPEHVLFTTGDRETVTLKAYKGDCFNSYSRTVDKNADAAAVAATAGSMQELRIYPNPASDQIFIAGSSATDIRQMNLSLYSLNGQKVRTQQLDNPGRSFRAALQLTGLPAGAYLLQVQADAVLTQHKILVQ